MFPVKAIDLVEMAFKRVNEQSSTIKDQLVDPYLPQTVEVILARQSDCRQIVKDRSNLNELTKDLGKILWSHPGSMGGVKIERAFIDWGFSTDEADVLATNIVRYSRYVMSVVNHLRHVRSAVTGIRDVLVFQQSRERFFGQNELPEWLEKEWFDYIKSLANRNLKDAADLSQWLSDIEIVITTLLRARSKRVLDISPSELNSIKSSERGMGIAQAYTRRFGRYIKQEFKVKDLGGRYATKDKSILDEFADLKQKLAGDGKEVFALLSEEYESRKNRIKVSITPPASRLRESEKSSRKSFFEEFISNRIKIDDREIIVRYTSEKMNTEIINQMYKLFQINLQQNPKLKRFEGKAERDGQMLIVELQEPEAKDANKIKNILSALLEN